jgi:Aspartyl protease
MNCPETCNIINEGLVMYNPHGRLVRPDGSELPRNTSGAGGMAKFLRDERINEGSSSKGKTREVPPHFAQIAGVQYDGLDLLNRDTYAISSTSTSWPISYPVTRSQKEPLYEPYPAKKPERKQKQAPILPPPSKRAPENREIVPPPPAPVQPPKAAKSSTPPKPQPRSAPTVPAPPPQPPYQNTADAWNEKKNVPKRTDQPDVEMQDASKSKGGYHFTSTIQDMADGDAIQSRILDTIITLPLRDIIGILTDLQKRFANLTKTRREYAQKTATTARATGSYEDHDCQSGDESDCDSDADNERQENAATTSRLQFSYGAHENVEDILQRYTSAVSLQAAPLFAMATGRFEGSMADKTVTFMVDTGSELNLMSAEFYRRTALPLDNDGARWSLKGINGPAVPLLGCVRDSPVSIGGHAFNHHFFVSSEGAGKQEIILGQPWMLWYAADISYSRSEGVQLHLWANGERHCASRNHRIPPTLSIQLCPIDSPRNADRLVLQARAHRATIEEVSDDDAEN